MRQYTDRTSTVPEHPLPLTLAEAGLTLTSFDRFALATGGKCAECGTGDVTGFVDVGTEELFHCARDKGLVLLMAGKRAH